MEILRQLCSIPTAPFVEDRVYRYVSEFVRARKRLRISKDRHGNRLILLPGRQRSPRLILVAHTDHPGFVSRRMIDARTLDADFRGGVMREYVEGSRVRFFDGNREITGTVIDTTPSKERASFPAKARVRVARPVSPNSPGMFDQGVGRVKGGKFLSRVCDDLAGAAAALTMLDQLARTSSKIRATVGVLLTRAEEDGFIGAIAAAVEPKLLRRDDLVISVECSAIQPYAMQGDGVIVRVGDRVSVFDSAFTYFITQQAEALAKIDKSFKHQRSLMPGGACEGTVFDAYGYRTGAVCVPLGNYHNMDREKKRIGPEYIDLSDWNGMVKLFINLAKNAHKFDKGMGPLKKRLEKRFGALKKLL